MALSETLRKAGSDGDADDLREGVWALAQAIMEAEASELTGVPHGTRDPEHRLAHRNGYRERRWHARVGTIDLAVPRARDGACLPRLLEPRRRTERALLAVAREACVAGVSTRRVDALVQALGIEGMSHSSASRMRAALDAEAEASRTRPLVDPASPCLRLDAIYVKVRDPGRVASMACLVATGAATTGERRVLRLELSTGSTRARPGPGSCARRSSAGSTACASSSVTTTRGSSGPAGGSSLGRAGGAVGPASRATPGTSCRGPPGAWPPRPSGASSSSRARRLSAREQRGRVIEGVGHRFPAVAGLLAETEEDLLAPFSFPEAHRRPIRPANPQERLDKEVKRRARVVGIFPTRASAIRLAGMILSEQGDERQDGRRCFRPEAMALIDATPEEAVPAPLMASRGTGREGVLLHHMLGLDHDASGPPLVHHAGTARGGRPPMASFQAVRGRPTGSAIARIERPSTLWLVLR